MYSKGQVSTEYLVILAVVLVVALVVVYLVGGFSSLGSSSLATQSMSYWGGATPLAITAIKVASPNTVSLQVTNDGLQSLTVTQINVNGTLTGLSGTLTFNPGQSNVITGTLATTATNCSTGQPFSYSPVSLVYTQGSISSISETGLKGLVGTCS
jgi:uncharacterized protein (UPF0333 family)